MVEKPLSSWRRWIVGLVVAAGLALALVRLWTLRSPEAAALPLISTVPEFSLLLQDSTAATRDRFTGNVSIADFVFTTCGGICPMMSTMMADLQKEFANDRAIQLVSFSVDPEHDTPSILTSYGSGYGAIPGKWYFITGDRATIYKLTREGFHLGLDIEGENAIIHSQKFVLVDQRAGIRGYYDSEDQEAMKRLVRDARQLARETD